MKLSDRVKAYLRSPIHVIEITFCAIFIIAFTFVLLIGYFDQFLTNQGLVALGKPTEIQAEFINKVSEDIKVTKEVRPLLGPYAPIVGKGRLLESSLSWFILLDEKFFIGLSDMEQKALIGHEMGHIIFNDRTIEYQEDADFFAAKYTSPETMIGLLNKLFTDPRKKNSQEYKLRLGNLENMEKPKQQFLQKHRKNDNMILKTLTGLLICRAYVIRSK